MADAVALNELFLKSTGDNLFALLEKDLKIEIPTLIKNVLKFFDYNCAIILAKLDDPSISSIEQNVRKDISADILLPGEKIEDYLGRFTKCQEKFKFFDGQRKWLELIGQTCRRFVGDIDPPTPTVTPPNVPVSTENGQSSNQSNDPKKGKPVPAHVTEDNLKELEELIFDWISSKSILSNCVESGPLTFHVVDHVKLGTVVLKCPISECTHCFSLSFLRYPRYNKTKRPRRGASAVHLSTAKWYIYVLQSHLLKQHSNETEEPTIDDRAPRRDNSSEDQRNENHHSRDSDNATDSEFNGFREENQESNSNDSVTSNHIIDNQISLKRKIPSKFTLRKKRKY